MRWRVSRSVGPDNCVDSAPEILPPATLPSANPGVLRSRNTTRQIDALDALDDPQRFACVDPRGLRRLRRRRVVTVPPRGAPRSPARWAAGAPECAPAGHSGAGHCHPHGCVRHVTSDESGEPAERRGGARSARVAPRGGVGTWKSGILGTCGAAARGRFSDFQDSRFSPPKPRTCRRRRPGRGQLQWTDRARRELETCASRNLPTVTGFQVFQIPRFP